MGALSADMSLPPRHISGTPQLELIYPASTADEFYIGAICCSASGLLTADAGNTDTTIGICLDRVTVTAQDDPVRVHVKGVWWIANATFDTADIWTLFAPTAASDNPAELITLAVGTPSALGTLVHIGTTATDGYIDQEQRVLVINT